MARVKSFSDQMLDKFGDEYAKVFIEQGNEDEVITAISTGSAALDVSIGIGGIPKRRYTIIDGPEGSAKTTLAFSIAKQAIKNGDRVLYVDVENQMSFEYIIELLGDNYIGNQLILTKPENSDDVFNICESAIASKEFGLIVLDSVAALSAPEEQERKFEQGNMMVIPRDLAKFLRRMSYQVRTNNVAFLFINQVRDAVGSYVKAYSTPGGHALKHYASVIISLTKGEHIEVVKSSGKDPKKEAIGIMTKFTIKKNKLAPPFRSFTIPIIFGVGVDTLRDAVTFAEELGVIQKAGAWYRLDGNNIGQGLLKTMEYFNGNKEVLDKVIERCYNTVSKYKAEQTDDEELNDGSQD